MRISDWSSDVCSSDLRAFQFRCQSQGSKKILLGSGGLVARKLKTRAAREALRNIDGECQTLQIFREQDLQPCLIPCRRSEEHTSELQSLMRITYAVFCLKT